MRMPFFARRRSLAVFALFVVAALAGSPPQACAQGYYKQTKNLRLVYLDPAHSYLVPYAVRCFENSMSFHRRLFSYTPSEEVTVLLHDFNDYGSGGTNTIPWNFLSIGIEPYDYVYETSPTNERMNWVMNHELVHVLATEKASGTDRFFRKIFFGKVSPTDENPLTMIYSYLTVPRWYSPRWYHEGIAVFMETWMAGGIGRVLGGYDEMVFRTMVRDSSYFYDYVGLESEGTTIDFQIGANSYLYGTRFMSWIALQYGPDKLLAWVDRSDTSEQYYANQFEHVFGASLGDEWDRWITWEHEWQRANLDSVRNYPITAYRQVTGSPLGSASRAFYDSTRNELYLAMNLPGQLARIVSIDCGTGGVRRLCDVTGPALYYVSSLAYDPLAGTIFYTSHNSSSARDINAVDVRTGKSRMLLQGARTGDLAFDQADKSLWGVMHHDGYSTLVRIPTPYTDQEWILPLKYGIDLFDLDISPDGTQLTASMIEVNGRQKLIRMWTDSLRAGRFAYDSLYEFDRNSPENFVFSRDGKALYGTTYYTGVSNIVRYDFAMKQMDWVTNTETGFFRPMPFARDSLFAFRYTGAGLLPVVLADTIRQDVSAVNYLGEAVYEKYPVVATWKLPPPSTVNTDSLIVASGEYSTWSHLKLASIYPVVEGYLDYTAVGLRANIADPLQINSSSVTASYTPSPGVPEAQRLHLVANLSLMEWQFSATANGTDFYDLFPPTRSSRKGYSLGVQYKDYLVYARPTTLELRLGLTGYAGLEELPEYQNIAATYDRFARLNAGLKYSWVRRSLGAVDGEDGVEATVFSSTTLVRKSVYPRLLGGTNLGTLLPVDHLSLWLRLWAGVAFGDRNSNFSSFYFGAFGNNIVDNGEVKRYREYYSFPGLEINSIGGATFGRAMLELNLPPLRFRQFGVPFIYCTWIRASVFGSGIVTDIHKGSDRTVAYDAGVQLDWKLVFFSHLDSMLSFGYGVGTLPGERRTDEFMLSIKLL